MRRVALAAILATTLAGSVVPSLAGSMFGIDLGDATVAVAVNGSADNPVLTRQAEQIIEEALRRNDLQVLGRQGLDRLLEDELYNAVVAARSATALLEIKKKYDTDVLFIVELDSEAAPGIGLNWVGTASLSATALRTETAQVVGSATSPPLGTTGYPSAIGETELAARRRAVQRATNGMLLRAALPDVNVPQVDPSVTPEPIWKLLGGGVISGIAVSSDSRWLAVLRTGGAAIHELETGKVVDRWAFRIGESSVIAFHPDGSRIAAFNDKGKVILCTRGNPACKALDASAARKVSSLRFDLDGTRLGASGTNGTALVWKLKALNEPVVEWRAHDGGPGTLFFLDDGERLITTSALDRTVRLWNRAGGAALQTFDQQIESGQLVTADCPSRCRVMGLALTEIELAGGASGEVGSMPQERETIRLIDAASGKEVARFEAHDDKIVSLGFGPSSRFLASADETGVVKLWDTERSRELATVRLSGNGTTVQVRLTLDGKFLVANRKGSGASAWALK